MARPALGPRLKLRGRVWWIYWSQLPNPQTTGCTDREEAEAYLARFLAARREGPQTERPTVNDLLDYYERNLIDRRRERALAGGASETELEQIDAGTARFDIPRLRQHLGTLYTIQICDDLAVEYRDNRRRDPHRLPGKKHVQHGTIRRELVTLKAAIKRAWKNNAEAWFPGAKTMPDFHFPVPTSKPRPGLLLQDQVRTLLEHCTTPHLRLFVQLAVQTAARRGAILALRWSDVDLDRGVIDFGRVDHNKRRPHVPIVQELREALLAAREFKTCEYVVEWQGGPIKNIRTALDAAAASAKIKVTAHMFKKSAISYMVQSGMSYKDVAELVETSEATVRTYYAYLHPDNRERMEKAVSLGLPTLPGTTAAAQPAQPAAPDGVAGLLALVQTLSAEQIEALKTALDTVRKPA